MPFVIGEQVGGYRIVEQRGQGGMSTVYRAYHAALDRYVALKVLHPMFKGDREFLARFQREARIVARLEHPNIVAIYDFSEHEGTPYLVMRFVEGRTLKALLSEEHPLPLPRILDILRPVCEALEYAHGQGVLHRDVKPSNVLIERDGKVFVTDFGLAKMVQSGDATISQDRMIGTPQYISPEQAKGEAVDQRTDLYSLGVVLYEMVVGRVPYTADTPFAVVHDHIFSPLPLPSRVNPAVPPAVEQVILKALAKAPADRYQTALEFFRSLAAAVEPLGESPVVAMPPPAPAPAAVAPSIPSTVTFTAPGAIPVAPATPMAETPAAPPPAAEPSPAEAAAGLVAALGAALAPGVDEVKRAMASARSEMAAGLSKAAQEMRERSAPPEPSASPTPPAPAAALGPEAPPAAAAPEAEAAPAPRRARRLVLWPGLVVLAVVALAALLAVAVPAIQRAQLPPESAAPPTIAPRPERSLPPRPGETPPPPPPGDWGEPYPVRLSVGYGAPGSMSREEAGAQLLLIEEAIGRDPGNPALHLERGNLLFLLERFPEAAVAYEKSYTLSGEMVWAHYNRGVAMVYMAQPEEALAEFQWVRDATGGEAEPSLYFNLALAHSMLGHREQAVAALREFVRRSPAEDLWRRRALEMLRRWGEE